MADSVDLTARAKELIEIVLAEQGYKQTQPTYSENQEYVISFARTYSAEAKTEEERAEYQAVMERAKADPAYADQFAEFMEIVAKQGDKQTQPTYSNSQVFVIGRHFIVSAQAKTEEERAEYQAVIERAKADPAFADHFVEELKLLARTEQGDKQAQREIDDRRAEQAKLEHAQQIIRAVDIIAQMYEQAKTTEEYNQILELQTKLLDPVFLKQFLAEADQAQAAKKAQPISQPALQPQSHPTQEQKKRHWWQR